MKPIIINIVILLQLNTFSYCQSGFEKDLKIAKAYNSIGEFGNALKYYRKCYKKQPKIDIVLNITNCYIQMREFKAAHSFITQSDYFNSKNPKLIELLGDLNLALGKYLDAKKYYCMLNPKTSFDSIKIQTRLLSCDSSIIWKSKPLKVQVVNKSNLNSSYSDAGPYWYKDGLVFSSTRESTIIKKTNGLNNQQYYDLYYSIFKDSTFKNPTPFSSSINSMDHEVGICFSEDQKDIIFTRSTHKEYSNNIDDNVNNLKLYKSHKLKLGWSKPEVFILNDSTSSFGHPAFGHGDNVFIFVSNLPGGYGGTDLYISFKVDSVWTIPENLGPNINTPFNENFPFLDQDDQLYFSSNGHIGLGGYDIYTTKIENGDWGHPKNLAYPINSSYDDFSFIKINDSKRMFFTSNREGGVGKEDIYEVIEK